jgi:hypothetical protein
MEHDRDYFREYESKFYVATCWCYNVMIKDKFIWWKLWPTIELMINIIIDSSKQCGA